MVGPWQVPVADCAVTLLDYEGYAGEAFAIGERTPLALIDAPASGRMAVGEALTNLASALPELSRVKLSANWMAAAGYPGEDAALYDTVKAVALELCPALGISIPVGKDSLSMRTAWDGNEVMAPLSLVVSAFAPADARVRSRRNCGRTPAHRLVLIDLARGRNRLGSSQLAQVYGQIGDTVPDLDDPAALKAFFAEIQSLNRNGLLLAYHDRSDGGLFACACEMAFAGHCGVTLNLDLLGYDPLAHDVDGNERRPELMQGRDLERVLAGLFAEELGALVQVRADDRAAVMRRLAGAGLYATVVGAPNARDEIRLVRNAKPVFAGRRVDLQRAWSEVSYRMQRLRDNPACAQEEFDCILDAGDPGLSVQLRFDPYEDVAAPFVGRGARPRVAILREQGVNGQVEMAAAFDRAGFAAPTSTSATSSRGGFR
jgi:phosphoribosylformylglycinamidine synthase